jgi:hypothetical protein
MGRFPTYVVTMLALDLLGLSLTTGLLPPDATTQTYALGATLLAAPLLAYWLVYLDGFERLRLRRLVGRHDGDAGRDDSDEGRGD